MFLFRTGDRRYGRASTGVLATALAVCTMVGTPVVAQAAVHTAAQPAPRARDLSLDGREDFLGRAPNGDLLLYPHAEFPTDPSGIYYYSVSINSGWNNASWISSADVNGDGKTDVLGQVGDRITLYPHSGNFYPGEPTLTLGPTHPYGEAGWSHFDLKTLQDMDGNGVADMVARGTDGALYFWQGIAGDGGTAPIYSAQRILSAYAGYDQLDVADVNNDGRVDLLGRKGSQLIAVFGGQPGANGVPVFDATGARTAGTPGASATAATYQVLSGGWDQATMTTTKDIDGDGKSDLVSKLKDGRLVMFRNTGVPGGPASFTGRIYLGTTWANITQIS